MSLEETLNMFAYVLPWEQLRQICRDEADSALQKQEQFPHYTLPIDLGCLDSDSKRLNSIVDASPLGVGRRNRKEGHPYRNKAYFASLQRSCFDRPEQHITLFFQLLNAVMTVLCLFYCLEMIHPSFQEIIL
jgi:hypothetical protein